MIEQRLEYLRKLIIDAELEGYGFDREELIRFIVLPMEIQLSTIMKLKELADKKNLEKWTMKCEADAMDLMNKQYEYEVKKAMDKKSNE